MPKQPIEPKPTQYGNILFRSRLEARWAVFFDFTDNVINWTYEPTTFHLKNGWDYTPDFLVKSCPPSQPTKYPPIEELYIEVKPTTISEGYRKTLQRFAMECNIAILVVQGNFYDNKPITSHLHVPKRRRTLPLAITYFFVNIQRGMYHASHFRFDLEGD